MEVINWRDPKEVSKVKRKSDTLIWIVISLAKIYVTICQLTLKICALYYL